MAEEGTTYYLAEISNEIRTLNRIMESMWTLLHPNEEPFYAKSMCDEYITMNEAARRLNVPIAQIKDWIVEGMRYPSKGWKQGIHYIVLDYSSKENKINAEVYVKRHQKFIRIPWNSAMRHITLKEQGTRKVQTIDLVKVRSQHANRDRYSENTFYEFLDEKDRPVVASVEELNYDDEEEDEDDGIS